MAALSAKRSKSATLSTTTVDTVTLTVPCQFIEVTNRSGSATIWFTVDGTVPTAAGDDVEFVLPGQSLPVPVIGAADSGAVVKVLGNGNDYTVAGTS